MSTTTFVKLSLTARLKESRERDRSRGEVARLGIAERAVRRAAAHRQPERRNRMAQVLCHRPLVTG